MQFIPQKLYYKIGEVCDILGVEAHVLRYWESEFPNLTPPKNKAGQRTYRPKDIELLLEIKKLLYDEGFTIAGARKRLGGRAGQAQKSEAEGGAASGDDVAREKRTAKRAAKPRSKRLDEVRVELENILTLLRRE